MSPSPSPSASATPTASPTASALPPVPKGKTRLTITLTNCDDCGIRAEQSIDWAHPNAHLFEAAGMAKNGVVVLTVPTKLTRGMVFLPYCSLCNSNNAYPAVALRYRGVAVGVLVNDSQAKNQVQASGCWIGTSKQRLDLAFTRTVFPDVIYGHNDHSVRVWASPQVGVIPSTWLDTYRGGIGSQNSWTCRPSDYQ